jgi:hypothetical protein
LLVVWWTYQALVDTILPLAVDGLAYRFRLGGEEGRGGGEEEEK